MRLEVGMLIRTNYSGPYRITKIERNCTCQLRTDEDGDGDSKAWPPHLHLECSDPDGKGRFWLNGFIEETLQSIEKSYCGHKTELGYDYIEIMESDRQIQMSIF